MYVEKSSVLLDGYPADAVSALSAARHVRFAGGLRSAYTEALGREARPPLAARPGDVVLFESASSKGSGALGICNGVSAVLIHPSQPGFSSLSMSDASCVWHIQFQ